MGHKQTPRFHPTEHAAPVFWAIIIGVGALMLINALLPDLDFRDRIGWHHSYRRVILDAQSTISELKQCSENPLVKAIVLRIDSPGAESCPRRKYTMREAGEE